MRVHHLNISCRNIDNARRTLQSLYTFVECGCILRSAAEDEEERSTSYVMVKENIYIVLKENADVVVDTIDDIAFCVDSVQQYCDRVRNFGGCVAEDPKYIDCVQRPFTSDNNAFSTPCLCGVSPCKNYIEKAIIKSSVGNIRHTLLDKRHFNGDFLPGFVANAAEKRGNLSSTLSHIDHVAFAVPCGETSKHIRWYQNCLQMTQFKTNVTESQSGLVIRGRNGNGLRMLTLEEHPCSNMAVTVYKNENEIELRHRNVKFVFAESLKDEGSDQIQIFLRYHGGSGVQHVAFYSNDITKDAQQWLNLGVSFVKPPAAYYREIESTLKKLEEYVSVDDLSNVGILVDAEKHETNEHGFHGDEDGYGGNENGYHSSEDGYLYQIFTEPVFDSHTFFFELIQRDNANGFGAGNVSALWRALDSRFKTLID